MKVIYHLLVFVVFCIMAKYLDVRISQGAGNVFTGVVFVSTLVISMLGILALESEKG